MVVTRLRVHGSLLQCYGCNRFVGLTLFWRFWGFNCDLSLGFAHCSDFTESTVIYLNCWYFALLFSMASDKGVQDENELCVTVELPATGAVVLMVTMHTGCCKGFTAPRGWKAVQNHSKCCRTETPVTKRKSILTPKALLDKLETLLKERKAKLNKASNLQKSIWEWMQTGSKHEVQCVFMKYLNLISVCLWAGCKL